MLASLAPTQRNVEMHIAEAVVGQVSFAPTQFQTLASHLPTFESPNSVNAPNQSSNSIRIGVRSTDLAVTVVVAVVGPYQSDTDAGFKLGRKLAAIRLRA